MKINIEAKELKELMNEQASDEFKIPGWKLIKTVTESNTGIDINPNEIALEDSGYTMTAWIGPLAMTSMVGSNYYILRKK